MINVNDVTRSIEVDGDTPLLWVYVRRALAPHFDAEHGRGPVDGECLVCAFFGEAWPSVGRSDLIHNVTTI